MSLANPYGAVGPERPSCRRGSGLLVRLRMTNNRPFPAASRNSLATVTENLRDAASAVTDGDAGVGFVRINGCALGVGCALSTPASQFRIESFSAPAPATAAIDPPVLSPLPPPLDEDEREAEAVITGAGNEEIWRRPDQ